MLKIHCIFLATSNWFKIENIKGRILYPWKWFNNMPFLLVLFAHGGTIPQRIVHLRACFLLDKKDICLLPDFEGYSLIWFTGEN